MIYEGIGIGSDGDEDETRRASVQISPLFGTKLLSCIN